MRWAGAVAIVALAVAGCATPPRSIEYLPAPPRAVADACLRNPAPTLPTLPPWTEWERMSIEERARAVMRVRANSDSMYESLVALYSECREWAKEKPPTEGR